ncbi:MAG: hypothetical protein L6R38_005077, partial [Xanthoria sp. 2 TBL-2021]
SLQYTSAMRNIPYPATNAWSLLFRQSDERLGFALTVTNESKLREICLEQDAQDQSWEVYNAYLTDVPVQHAWIFVGRYLVPRIGPTAIVAEPYIVAELGKVESKAVVVVGIVYTSGLK